MEHMLCPKCNKKTVYMSQLNILVCGNKACGVVFTPLSTKQHYDLRLLIKSMYEYIEMWEEFRKKVMK